jgi:integrase
LDTSASRFALTEACHGRSHGFLTCLRPSMIRLPSGRDVGTYCSAYVTSKTREASSAASMLKKWKDEAVYVTPDDWVFASVRTHGKRPVWGQSLMRKKIHPVAKKLGINKRIGWHTFRHSYSSILRSLGTDIKVQQDLLRHSSARLTLDTHTQSVTTAKREAQDAVIRLLVTDDQSTLNAPA